MIILDMDGTIADFYSVPNWLKMLQAEDPTPYKVAKPLVNLSVLARLLNKAQRLGQPIGVISWTSKNSSAEYAELVKIAKLNWLKRHLPSVQFDKIDIIPYGEPKSKHAEFASYLFDDEPANREEWSKIGEAFSEKELLQVLKELVEG